MENNTVFILHITEVYVVQTEACSKIIKTYMGMIHPKFLKMVTSLEREEGREM